MVLLLGRLSKHAFALKGDGPSTPKDGSFVKPPFYPPARLEQFEFLQNRVFTTTAAAPVSLVDSLCVVLALAFGYDTEKAQTL